jgi:hypothetical protein
MAHFAQLNEHNMVTQVIVVDNEKIMIDGVESEQAGKDFIASIGLEGNWVQCSYSSKFRGFFPGPGAFFDWEKSTFLTLGEKSNWLKLPFDYEKNPVVRGILIDGFPRSGNIYLSYLTAFAFKNCEQRTGLNDVHDKDSLTEVPKQFDATDVPVRNPADSIKSYIALYNMDVTDTKAIFQLAADNLEWMKLTKANKDKLIIVDFETLISNPEAIVNKIAKAIKEFPFDYTNEEVLDRINEDGLSFNLPNETTSNNDVDLSNPLIAEVIAEATEIYNSLISNNGSN